MQRCLFALLREFTRKLKSKRDEFAARILQEEQLVKSRKRQQPPIPPANRRLSSLRRTKDKLLNYLDHGHASASEERPAVVSDIWHYMVGSDGAMIPKLHFRTLLTRFSSPNSTGSGPTPAVHLRPPVLWTWRRPPWTSGTSLSAWLSLSSLGCGSRRTSRCHCQANLCERLKLNPHKSLQALQAQNITRRWIPPEQNERLL